MSCTAWKALCRCALPAGHDGPHECGCFGSWDDEGWVHHWPEMVCSGPYRGERIVYPELPPVPFYEPGDQGLTPA